LLPHCCRIAATAPDTTLGAVLLSHSLQEKGK
jgi:hypothetical protein